jgi:ATP-binding cassette subfamily F protein 3
MAGLLAIRDTPVDGLSGGERSILGILAAAAGGPELLLIDEPGNHLDFAGLEWLEGFLFGYRGAVMYSSHDRALIDRTAGSLLALEGGKAERFPAGYSAWWAESLRRRAGEGQAWQADRKRLARLEALVARFEAIARARPDPAWGKRLRARRRQLERAREDAALKPEGAEEIRFHFEWAESRSDIALELRGPSCERGGRALLRDASFILAHGERIALVGPNGCGKTSLLEDIARGAAWCEGTIRLPPSRSIGYCAQRPDAALDAVPIASFLVSIPRPEGWRPLDDRGIRRLLGAWGLPRGCGEKRIGELSGGEWNKFQFAAASARGANVLLFDEPTNHLDIPSREELEEAIDAFGGSCLIVSHDRWFLERVADRVLFYRGESLVEYEGSLAEWWRDEGRAAAEFEAARRRVGEAKLLKAARPGRRESMDELASRIEALEAERAGFERRAEDAVRDRRYEQAKRFADEAARLGPLIDELYGRWIGA